MRVPTGVPSMARRGVWLGAILAAALLAVPRSAAGAPLPVVFEANHGQTDPRVKFLARGAGYTLFITTAEAVLADRQTASPAPSASRRATLSSASTATRRQASSS